MVVVITMDVIGCMEGGLIAKIRGESSSSKEGHTTELRLVGVKSSNSERIWSLKLSHEDEGASDIIHATVKKLRNEVPENLAEGSSSWLVGLVKHRLKGSGGEEEEYLGELLLVQHKKDELDCVISDRIVVVQWQEYPLKMHLISNSSLSVEAAHMNDSLNRHCVRNGLVVLFLSQCES